MNRVLVISPHPDDESIGCGGTLCRHVEQGDRVQVVFMTSGEKGGHGRAPAETMAVREREAAKAAAILGIRHVEFWRHRDGALEATREIVGRLRDRLKALVPDVVYAPHDREMHPDHRGAARALKRALRMIPRFQPKVLMFEVWTPIQRLDEIVDISPFLTTKLRAVRAYGSQCAVVGFPEAVRGLNRYRGEMHCWPGGDYAEVFCRLRL